jgi:hypothetical protein
VLGVRGQILGVAPTEGDDQRATKGQCNSLQGFEVRIRNTPFDSAFDHAAKSGALRKFRSRQLTPLAKGLDLCADPCPLFAGAALSLDGQSRTPDTRHDRHMFICRASPPLIPLSTRSPERPVIGSAR